MLSILSIESLMKVLITGLLVIGYHLASRLLAEGMQVYGIDNLNDYYDVNLKKDRLYQLHPQAGFTFQFLDLADREGMLELFQQQKFDYVVNLAAQAGALFPENPLPTPTVISPVLSTFRRCRQVKSNIWCLPVRSTVPTLKYRSPSAITLIIRFRCTLRPKANELIAHVYSHLYELPTTGLRFFTVYGPGATGYGVL